VKTLEKLGRVRGLPRPVEEKHGQQLVDATLRAIALPPAQMPQNHTHEPTPSERFRAESLWAAGQTICAGQGIDPALVTNRSEVVTLDRMLAREQPLDDLPLMKGWRRTALGEPLVELAKGSRQFNLRWDANGMRVAPESAPT
jgi:ribonuclease D